MSDFINEKAVEEAAEGFWNKHKWCVVGCGLLLILGIVLGCLI